MNRDDLKNFVDSTNSLLNRFAAGSFSTDRIVPGEEFRELRKRFPIRKMNTAELTENLFQYFQTATRTWAPEFMGHQVSHPHPSALMGEAVHAVSNNSIAVHDMGAAGIAIERNLVDWFLGQVPWSAESAGGILTHGGSLANLTALLVARGTMLPDSWAEGVPANAVIIVPSSAHYCLPRAVAIMGFGSQRIRSVECNANGTMKISALKETVAACQKKGERICAIVATAASTATGAFDQLDEVAAVAQEHGIWFHVDGAHGASALISAKHRSRLKGIEKADSIVWDAHKMMRVPSLCTAVLFRNRHTMETAFSQEAPYLAKETAEDWELRNPFLYTIECTRPSLGLKLYPVLCAMGERGLEHYVDQSFALAQEAYHYLDREKDFEVPIAPESNILIFRRKGISDDQQHQIYREVLRRGRFHITFTKFQGSSYLRLSLMNPATSLRTVEALVVEIQKIFSDLESGFFDGKM